MCTKCKLIYFAFLMTAVTALHAQEEPLNSAYVEEHSYRLYLDKNWKELCTFGNKAIAGDFDYYYLRLRLGIAFFERRDYYVAEKHFQKALTFNASDPLSQEYLYYCYLNTCRYEDAKWLSRTFNEELVKRIATRSSPFSFIGLEGGMKINTVTDSFSSGKFIQIGLGHYLFKRVSLYHSFNYYTQESYSSRSPEMQVTLNDQNHYDSVRKTKYRVISGKQIHYFLRANIPFKNDFLVSASAHYIHDFNSVSEYDTTVVKHETPPPGAPAPPVDRSDTLVKSRENHPSYVATLSVRKRISHFELSLGFTYNHIDVVTQFQENLGVEYHPFGNDKLLIGVTGYTHTESGFDKNAYAVVPYVSFCPLKKLTVTADYMRNTDNNIVEFSGYYVNNSSYFTDYRSSVSLAYQASKKIIVYGNYIYEHKYMRDSDFTFNNNIFLVGITIIP